MHSSVWEVAQMRAVYSIFYLNIPTEAVNHTVKRRSAIELV